MRICLIDAGKRYDREWIFRHANLDLKAGHSYAITGPNGSGKSTLLQVIGGMINPSTGRVEYHGTSSLIDDQTAMRQISIAAPYMELIEEMTGYEFLRFHISFRPLMPTHTIDGVLDFIGLSQSAHKQIRNYSSGMKQRLRLAQAFFSEGKVLLLDEPCTNLDRTGIELYKHLFMHFRYERLSVVSSNDEEEFALCDQVLSMSEWKGQ